MTTAVPTTPGGGRRQWWVQIVVAAALTGLFALGCLGGVIDAANPARHQSTGRASSVVLAVVMALLAAVCGRWAAHAEHALRSHTPAAASWVRLARVPRSGLAGRRYSPRVSALRAVLFTGVTLLTVVIAVHVHGQQVRSSYTQSRGVREVAMVAATREIAHHGRYSTWYTCEMSVGLASPVGGAATSVVHYPSPCDTATGARIAVLVDPEQPDYAEVPGAPSARRSQWLALVIMAVAFGAMAAFMGRAWYRMRRHAGGHLPAS